MEFTELEALFLQQIENIRYETDHKIQQRALADAESHSKILVVLNSVMSRLDRLEREPEAPEPDIARGATNAGSGATGS